MPNIGPLELVIVLVIVLVIFGPKRLPGLGRQLGGGMREFKDAITGKGRDDADADESASEERPTIARTSAPEGDAVTADQHPVAEDEPAARPRA
jgi:sec-independent protein translocase protein TatA